jgi:oligopeptide transport system permease protein
MANYTIEDIEKLKPSEIPEELFAPLSDDEKNSEFVALESKTYIQDAWNRFKKNKLALIGLIFILVMVVLAILVPILSPYTYDMQDMLNRNAGCSLAHPFGTDKFGRDILVRVMYGARISLSVGFAAAALNLVIGVVYGGICGYIGGKLDMILMRLVDILYSVPTLLYVILIMLIFGSNIFSVLLAICISSWVGMARQVRAQVLSLKQQEFSLAAYVIGASKPRILFKHLIINCMGPIIVNTTMMVPSAIFTEAFLAFVGIGISIPMASWGTMANEARAQMMLYPMQIVWPVAAICLTMLSLHFIGDGMSEALDPKKR